MLNITIGLITNSNPHARELNKFKRIAKMVGVGLEIFNAADDIDVDIMQKKAKKCDVIFNDEADYINLELAKTLELLGHRVVEFSKTYYYSEDKWLTYLNCLKNKIPVPKTILLSSDLPSIRKELKKFDQFPVIIKRVEGMRGEFVDKADDIDGAISIIKKFWKKGDDRFPVLAQEFVHSYSYRVMTIGGEVVQTAVKKNDGWKATGGSASRFARFKIDKDLKAIIERLASILDIVICGIDFAKKGDFWVLIEINAEPSFKFFDCDYDLIIEKVLRYLKKISLQHIQKTRS